MLLTLVLVGAIAGSYMFNKKGPDIANASGVKVSAAKLFEAFSKDSVLANKTYLDKIVEVSGQVTKLNKNQQSQSIVLLKTNTAEASINCTLESPAGTNIKEGTNITIKGICTGLGQGDADFGILPDVYLSRCYIVDRLQNRVN